MASSRVPDLMAMRELKYGKGTPEQRDTVAKALRDLGRRSEAILLYEGRADHPFVAEEVRWAADHGDAFLLLTLRKMGAPVGDDRLRACAEAAERAERWLDARQAWSAVGDEAAIVRISPNLPPSLAAPPNPTTTH